MTNKRKLHGSIIKTAMRCNKIKSKSRVDALSCGLDGADAEVPNEADSDGEIDGVTISDMFGDETSEKNNRSKSYGSGGIGGLKKKTRKHREDASEFIIPNRPSAAAAAAGQLLLCYICPDFAPNFPVVFVREKAHRASLTRFTQTKLFPSATTSTCGLRTWCAPMLLC
jgi:hypothetical protein